MSSMHLFERAQIQIAKRITIHCHHILFANEAGGIPQSAGRTNRGLLERVEQVERAIPLAEHRGDRFSEMSDAKHGSLEVEAQELVKQEGDEWSACDLSQRFWSVTDDCSEPAAQTAGQDERFASYGFTSACKASSSLRGTES